MKQPVMERPSTLEITTNQNDEESNVSEISEGKSSFIVYFLSDNISTQLSSDFRLGQELKENWYVVYFFKP